MVRVWALLALACALPAQDGLYRFEIDLDALSGAPDFSAMNRPIGPEDRIFVRDGHFFRVGPDRAPHTEDDERVRFFGMNLSFGGNFPETRDAARVARRLRKLGVNVVRLHHMDSSPDANPNNANSLLTTGPYPTLNPVSVARLRAFLDALKAEGVYVNFNLHVGYQFRPAVDGVPALPGGQAIPTQSKPLHLYHPRMIELQQRFTRDAIDALGLRDDPVLAHVEISNETALVREWQARNFDASNKGEYLTEWTAQWNRWLAARYGTTEALRDAWGATEPPGDNLLNGRWQIEIHSPSRAALVPGDPVAVRIEQSGNWVYLKQTGFSLTAGRPYLAEVELRADLPDGVSRQVFFDVKQDVSPWRSVTGRNIQVTNQWQRFTLSLSPTFAIDNVGRVAWAVENAGPMVYARNASLRPAPRRGLDAAQSLQQANVTPVGEDETPTPTRLSDYLLFLADRDRHYLDAMLAAVRESADPLIPVAGTQVTFGGLLNLDSHASLDYQDTHFYVDHPNFPNVAWDARDWRIRDSSFTGGGLAEYLSIALHREWGRPFTVSEFNQAWPNRQGQEIDPALAAYGAFQDWDGILHFAFSHNRSWDARAPSGFDLNADMAKLPGAAQSAWLFRSGAIAAGLAPVVIPTTLEARVKAAAERRQGGINGFLAAQAGMDASLPLRRRVGVSRDEESPVPEEARTRAATPVASDTGQLTYGARLLKIQAEAAAGVIGYAGSERVTTPFLDLQLASGARGFASLVVTPLDRRPLAESRHMLLSHPGYALRSLPGTNPPRPQQLVRYPGTTDWWTVEPETPGRPSGDRGSGATPIWLERIEATVWLRAGEGAITVYPLNADGSRRAPLEGGDIERDGDAWRLHLHSGRHEPSPWYEIVRPE